MKMKDEEAFNIKSLFKPEAEKAVDELTGCFNQHFTSEPSPV